MLLNVKLHSKIIWSWLCAIKSVFVIVEMESNLSAQPAISKALFCGRKDHVVNELDFLKTLLSYNKETGDFIWIATKPKAKHSIGDIAGCTRKDGYKIVKINQKPYLMHRLAWLYVYGSYPIAAIDHINGNTSDNRIYNLREVSQQENNRNMKLAKNNKSLFTGVYWSSSRGMWAANITLNKKTVYLGLYDSIIDAVAARMRSNSENGFHNNHGRNTQVEY